jgi:hypothetical protein
MGCFQICTVRYCIWFWRGGRDTSPPRLKCVLVVLPYLANTHTHTHTARKAGSIRRRIARSQTHCLVHNSIVNPHHEAHITTTKSFTATTQPQTSIHTTKPCESYIQNGASKTLSSNRSKTLSSFFFRFLFFSNFPLREPQRVHGLLHFSRGTLWPAEDL